MALKNLPNILTVLRIMLIPVLVLSFYLKGEAARYVAASIFIFASFTDYLDGLLARLWKFETSFGRMLDPVADKMLVISTLVMLVHKDLAPVLPILAIICREILISGLREHLAQIKVSVPVSGLAKLKTALQMISILIILLGEEVTGIQYADNIGIALLWATACLTILTGYIYCKASVKYI
jgi:cardiolipin synthase (CMP-forming)